MNHQKAIRFPRAGYRIHFDRLKDIRAEANFIKTHKFKCKLPEDIEARKELKEKFDLISRVVDSTGKGSGLWFIIQLAGMGLLFPSAGNKYILYKEKFGTSDSFDYPVPNPIKLNKLLQTGIDSHNLDKELRAVFNLGKEDTLPDILKRILLRFQVELGKGAKLGSKSVGFNQWGKDIIADELNCPAISQITKGEVNIIFNDKFLEWNSATIQKWLELDDIPEISTSDDSFFWFFNNILPASQFLNEKSIDLLNPYHVLGKFVREWREDISSIKSILEEQIPQSFTHKNIFIDLVSRKIQSYSREVLQEEYDFIANDWAKYRETNFSGRISGWLSNFQNRLKTYEDALSDNIHKKELDNWGIHPDLANFLLILNKDGETYQFKLNPEFIDSKAELPVNIKDLFTSEINKKTGEIIKFKLKSNDFRTKKIKEKFKAINKSHSKILNEIFDNCDWENIFPEEIKVSFQQLRELQPVLLAQLRETTLATSKRIHNEKTLGENLEKYRFFLRNVREFLAQWNNEGIINNRQSAFNISLFKGTSSTEWGISHNLVTQKSSEESPDLDGNILGFWKKDFIPTELKKYPSFIGQAQKISDKELNYAKKHNFNEPDLLDEKVNIFNAKFLLLDYARYGSLFCSKIESQVDSAWEDLNWFNLKKVKDKNLEVKWHLGAFHKTLDSLLNLSHLAPNPKFIHNFLKEFTNQEIPDKVSPFRFYLSGKEYSQKYKLIDISQKADLAEFLYKFEKHFGLSVDMTEQDWEQFFELNSHGIGKNIVIKGELLKLWWSLRLKNLKEDVELPSLDIHMSEFIKHWVSLDTLVFNPKNNEQKASLSRKIALRFLQSGFASEIRGKISLLSRKTFIKRNVLAIENGEQSLLRYVPREWNDFSIFDKKKQKKLAKKAKNKSLKKSYKEVLEKYNIEYSDNQKLTEKIFDFVNKNQNEEVVSDLLPILGEIPHSWGMVLKTKSKFENLEGSLNTGFFIEKSKEHQNFNFSRRVTSNYYYSPFPIETSRYQKQFLEKFLFGANTKNELIESIQGTSIILEESINIKWRNNSVMFESDKLEMYWAIPFKFSNKYRNRSVEKGESYRKSVYNKGENLLGVDLGEYGFGWAVLDTTNKKFIAQGFQSIPLLKKMRNKAKSWKDTQSKGIFSRPTTYLADIREQAAGQARNQIHRLALEFNAKPIYEDEVDAFETGGNRIQKLYKTLKTADVISGASNDADKTIRKRFWGVEFTGIGGVIGASKTSQTCRTCGRCATAEIEDEIRNSTDKIVKEELRKKIDIVKKSQRTPNLSCLWRGGDALFVCQLCGAKTDADEQAAKNIALKFYLAKVHASEQDKKNKEFQTKKGYFSSLKFFLYKSKDPLWRND